MKVQALRKVYFGKTLLIGNKEVEFDSTGIAEVPKDHALLIIEKYPTMVGEVGASIQVKEMPKVEDDKIFKELQERLDNAVKEIDTLKKQHAQQVSELENEVNSWKAEWEKTQDGGMVLVSKAVETLETLQKLKVDDLKGAAKDMNFPEEEFGNLKQSELVLYLFKKTLVAK